MTDPFSYNWKGDSGEFYLYWIYPIKSLLTDFPGNFIFAKECSKLIWEPIFIGQTKNLDDRPGFEAVEEKALSEGATHIHCRINFNELRRLTEVSDLVNKYNPVVNNDEISVKINLINKHDSLES